MLVLSIANPVAETSNCRNQISEKPDCRDPPCAAIELPPKPSDKSFFRAISSDKVIDIFDAAGLKKPDICRSQYDFIDGFAKHMRDALPKASFIGFTGTPIESGDKNTQAVFGDYIDVYDILQSKEDKATVPIYYEARLAKIDLKPEERPKIDPNFEEVTEDAEESTKESLRRKWAQ